MYKYLGHTHRLAALHAITCSKITSPHPRAFVARQVIVISSFSTGPNNDRVPSDEVTRQDILDEAAALTRSLYRRCLRSVKVIRWGNSFDDQEFQRREEDFLKPSGGPGGMISMAPPPDKDDELRSRAEYYQSYTREHFVQESDCLDNNPLTEKHIKRYLYYLRKGDKDRKWLLADMMFPDPYKTATDNLRMERFEAMAKKYLGGDDDDEDVEHQTADDYFDADDGNPEWFQKLNK